MSVTCRTYKRPKATIEITPQAENLLGYDNVNLDKFANELYLFSQTQDFKGNDFLRVRASTTPDGLTLWVGFLWRKKDKKVCLQPVNIYKKSKQKTLECLIG